MAICLPEFYSTKPSTISFHTTPFKKRTSAGLIPNSKFPTFYFINLNKIFVNDKEIPLFPSLSRNFGNGLTGGCIVDTGATVTSFPEDFYEEFRDTFRKEVRCIPLYDAPLGNFDTCYMVDPGEVANFPAVKMYFGTKTRKICCY
uniref:Aspartic proteinase nepenthesin-1 n=1 Tax=Solanum tuberosum TaxID=4113 RepID=M1DCA7_SOLTU